MKNILNKGRDCLQQKVVDCDGNEGIIIDFFVEGGKKSKVVIQYADGTRQTREKYAVQKGAFRKPCIDDIESLLATEEWKYIPGFNERYIISKTGDIKSAQGVHKGKLLSPATDTNGYLIIALQTTSSKNSRKLCRVHRLMAITFIREPEVDEEVNHIDGNRQNNTLPNLEIISKKENNKKYVDFDKLGLSSKEMDDIQKFCLEHNLTLKDFMLQKIRGDI